MKNHIWNYFEILLMSKDTYFSDIRIAQICESANIHRSTFYRHFEDKYKLLEYGLKKLWEEYFQLPKEKRVYEPFQTAESFYKKSKGKKLINKHLSDDNFIMAADRFFLKEMRQSVLELLPENPYLLNDLLASFMVNNIQVIEEWKRDNIKELTNQELDAYYQKLVLKSLTTDLK